MEIFNLHEELEDYFSLQYNAKQFLQQFPDVKSFRYGREGLIFEGNNRPYPVHFGEIKAVNEKGDNIEFTLIENLKLIASKNTNNCTVNMSLQNTDTSMMS